MTKLTVAFNTPAPVKRNEAGEAIGSLYHKSVTLDKVKRILEQQPHKTILIVNRLNNLAVPVIVCHDHYYYRSRAKNGRFIWMRHKMKPLMMNDHHKDMWDAYFYTVDFEEMLRDNILNFGGERLAITGNNVTLEFNP